MKQILTTDCTEDTAAFLQVSHDTTPMSEQRLNVQNLPQEIDAQELSASTVIVVDLLRATTTICFALAAGASEVVPFRTIEETLAAADLLGREKVVLGGERGGRRIAGFDLGNSPREYTPQAVRGRPVYITTTNGTRALFHARFARRVLVGSIVNLSAVVASVKDEPHIDILCAGTDGRETREDILAAGAMVHELRSSASGRFQASSKAERALAEWQRLLQSARDSNRTESKQLAIVLRETQGGRNLLEIGLDQDLVDCAEIDRLTIVPVLDIAAWRIRLAQ
jgi:2-phosphosulfolactate phosphatase